MKSLTNNIKSTSLLSIAIFAILSGNAQANITDSIEKTYDFSATGKIRLSNINGDVSIEACDCQQVTLKADISASSQEMRDRMSIEIKDSNDTLSIKTKYKERQSSSWHNQESSVTYTLSVPNEVILDGINLVNGNLTIKGVSGALDADLVNGTLNSDGLTGTTKVNLVNGDMDIRFENLNNAKNIDLEAVNGDINIYLPANADADVDAETVSGSISNEFGLEVIKHKYVGSEMRGMIGSGTTNIKLENVNGKIAVKSI